MYVYGTMTAAEFDEWYAPEPYDQEIYLVECEVCGAEVAEDDSTDDGLCEECAAQ